MFAGKAGSVGRPHDVRKKTAVKNLCSYDHDLFVKVLEFRESAAAGGTVVHRAKLYSSSAFKAHALLYELFAKWFFNGSGGKTQRSAVAAEAVDQTCALRLLSLSH